MGKMVAKRRKPTATANIRIMMGSTRAVRRAAAVDT
jgi:hypothetical protein